MVYIGTMENLRVEQITAEQGEFPHADDPSGENVYFACSLGEKVFCYVHIIIVDLCGQRLAVFHLSHQAFSPLIFRAMIAALRDHIRPFLRERRVDLIVGGTWETTRNWPRLMNLLGFDVFRYPESDWLYIRQEVG